MLFIQKNIEVFIHPVLWILFFIFFVQTEDMVVGLFTAKNQNIFFPFFYGTIINAIIFYACLFKTDKFNLFFNKFYKRILWALIILFLFSFIETIIDMKFIAGERLLTIKDRNVSPFQINLVLNVWFVLLAFSYRFMKDWFKNERIQNQLKEEKLKHELAFLKTQINPHFLFNSLNNIFSLAHEEEAIETANAISKLASIMRYMLHESDKPMVELSSEIKYLTRYIELQKLRLAKDKKIEIIFETDINDVNKKVAPALFLPMVENSFKHGISYNQKSSIKIRISQDNNVIKFTAINNIVKNDIHAEESGIGLNNLEKRLELLYPKKHKFTYSRNNDSFTIVFELEGEPCVV